MNGDQLLFMILSGSLYRFQLGITHCILFATFEHWLSPVEQFPPSVHWLPRQV